MTIFEEKNVGLYGVNRKKFGRIMVKSNDDQLKKIDMLIMEFLSTQFFFEKTLIAKLALVSYTKYLINQYFDSKKLAVSRNVKQT